MNTTECAPPAALSDWLQTAPGRYLLAWEQEQFDLALADLFGYNALQLGLPELDALRANRMPRRWLALSEEWVTPPPCLWGLAPQTCGREDRPAAAQRCLPALCRLALVADAAALPFPAASLDLVVLPHTLEFSADPHQVLREVERVLVPEGRVVISGLNPLSLWGVRQWRGRADTWIGRRSPGSFERCWSQAGESIRPGRLRDWLHLLSFEVESERCGCFRPAVQTDKWLQRSAWMDRSGARWWPFWGAAYLVVAVKRVRGMRLLGPAWKPRRVAASTAVPLTHRHLGRGRTQ